MQDLVTIASITLQLNTFAADIEQCFNQSDWEKLSLILTDRQHYLESVFVSGAEGDYRHQLEKIAQKVLAEDQDALNRVQAHQHKLTGLHGLMDQGMKAVKAYGG